MTKEKERFMNIIIWMLRPQELDNEYWLIERSAEWYKAHFGLQNEEIMV
jgi:hypothetical protein